MNTNPTKEISRFYPILIITLCACFVFYKYVLQIYPSVITNQLMREFYLTGAGLGNLAATYYYAYIITQLFVGVILDKYSTRWITSTAIFGCAIGVFWFAHARIELTACLSRGLMGVGVAFATISYMKLAAVWFPPRRYAFVTGCMATAVMVGAVFSEAPLSWLTNLFGWRDCLYAIGVGGFILAISFAAIVRDVPGSSSQLDKHLSLSLQDVLQIIKNKQNWLLTFYNGLVFAPMAVFGGLWGNPFLQQAYHLSKVQSASLVSLTFIGLGIGSPLVGIFSDRIGDRRHVMFFGTLLSSVAMTIVLYCHPMPTWLLGVMLFSFGFTLGAFMLVYTVGKELNGIRLTATAIAMINTGDAVLAAITEPGIGKLLDWGWDGKIVDGVHYFSLHSYHMALAVLPIYLIISALLLFWVKDTQSSIQLSSY